MNVAMTPRILTIILGIVAAAALRLVPHPPNFSPIDAMALFSGAYLGRRALAFVAPLAAGVVADVWSFDVVFVVAVTCGMIGLGLMLTCVREPRPRLPRAAAAPAE